MTTALKAHKFINPQVTGKRTAEKALGARMVLAHNRIGATVHSLGEAVKEMTTLTKARISFLKEQDYKADQAWRYKQDQKAEALQESDKAGGVTVNVNTEDKDASKDGIKEGTKEEKSGIAKFFDKLLGPWAAMIENLIRFAVIIPTLQWIADPENQKKLTTFLEKLGKAIEFLSGLASGSIGLVMNGITTMFGKDQTVWDRFKGFFQLIAGLAGLKALQYLLNPIALIEDLANLMDWLFDGLDSKAKKTAQEIEDAKSQRAQGQQRVDDVQKTKKYQTSTRTAQLKQQIMARYGFKSEEQYIEFRKQEKILREKVKRLRGPSANPTPKDLQVLSTVIREEMPATMAGKLKKKLFGADGITQRIQKSIDAKVIAPLKRQGNRAVGQVVETTRRVGGWAADRWKQMISGASTLKAKWDATYSALSDLAGKKWESVKGNVLKRIDDMGGPLADVVKKLKGPIGQRIMKYLPFAGDIFGFIMDVMSGVHWQRALIRSIVGMGIDAGATALIGALVAATPLTGGASTALAVALTAAYMGADMMVPGGFRVLLGDPVANFLKIPMFSKDRKPEDEKLKPNEAKPKSAAEIEAEHGKIQRQIPQAAIRKVEKLRQKEKTDQKETGGQLKGNDAKWAEFYEYGKKAGAKYPEAVSAQFALESGWGRALSGKNNFFGIKAAPGESATYHNTQEWAAGKGYYGIKAPFKNFASPQDAVNHLVSQWYKDYKGYKGMNRAKDALEVALLLKQASYATSPTYTSKLQQLMRQYKSVTEKIKGGKVTYPKGNYADPGGQQGVAGGDDSSGSGSTGGADAVQMTPAQMFSSLAEQISKINKANAEGQQDILGGAAPATPSSPVGGVQNTTGTLLSSQTTSMNDRNASQRVQRDSTTAITVPIAKVVPINTNSQVTPVYSDNSTPMAMSRVSRSR